ncbi:MAG: hypothetical protein A2505_06100 [Deltaproteobacteria bacterium RIFOXYD12_FULL_55_16]|nr:MAG: hypothetical protein A2505_06100 [Deltaproteobacteria bacterium RIFOXYD12_FULL_55_16]
MDQSRYAILSCLQDCSFPERQIASLIELIEQDGTALCKVIIHVLSHLDLPLEEAERCWWEIVQHHSELSALVGRTLSLQTAMCDYFSFASKHIKNPKIVDMHLFEETLQELSIDYLTGLSNKKVFERHLVQELAKAERRKRPLSLIFLDLDNFKYVNDNFGHQAGDLVLKRVSSIINTLKRIEDTASRYGGEEIAIILSDTDKYQALIFAERIRVQIEEMRLNFAEHEIKITISAGIAAYPMDAGDEIALLSNADYALYSAKRNGKNLVSLYQAEKRRYLRIDFTQSLEIRILGRRKDNKRQPLTQKSKDLCLAGILFESNSVIKLDTNLEIKIDLEGGSPLLLCGRVARVEKLENGKYDIGIAFQSIEGTIRHILSKYICQQCERMEQICQPTRYVFESTRCEAY